MAIWLQVILAVALVVVVGYLVPLLRQLRSTAGAVERLAHGAERNLGQIAEDIHHLRERADELADRTVATLDLPLALGRVAAGTASAVEAFLGRGSAPWLGALLTGLKFALKFIRRPKKPAADEEATHE